MVHAVRQPCPPVLRSMGGQAQSEDDRRCSFELPTHPRFLRFSSTLVVLRIFLLSLVTVGDLFSCSHPKRTTSLSGHPPDSEGPKSDQTLPQARRFSKQVAKRILKLLVVGGEGWCGELGVQAT